MAASRNITTQRQIVKMLVLLPTAAAVLAAAWISGMAIFENIHFARATGQIIRLVTATHDVATADKNFAVQPGEDILGDLAHAGLLSDTIDGKPVTLQNPWQGSVTALTSAPSMMRIESGVPSRDCRRLALFFARNAADLGLKIMEVREDGAKVWRRFYDRTSDMPIPDSQSIEAACEQMPQVTLALVFALR